MDQPVRTAGREDEAAVLAIITLAFAADPIARWATPDPAKFLASMPPKARAICGMLARRGVGRRAARCPDRRVRRPERLPEVGALMERMAEQHPREPHWYLPLIGTDPARQGRGLGSLLMRHGLARLDAEGMPAYL